MNPQKALCKLSAKISNMQRYGHSTPDITWEDVAAALPKSATPLPSLLIRVKWAGQSEFWEDLLYWTGMDLWNKEWQTKDPRRAQRLVEVAARDWLSPSLCHRCGGHELEGRTVVWSRGEGRLARTCPACLGTGIRRPRSGRSAARIVGVDDKTWRTTWKKRYEWLLARMNDLEAQALRTLQRNLKEGMESVDSHKKST